MNIIDIIILGIALSMDACTIAFIKGNNRNNISYLLKIGITFGIFQAIMPLIGYTLSNLITKSILGINKILSSIILIYIGINMINEKINDEDNNKNLIILAIATSIDALASGITLIHSKIYILYSIFIIGLITFIISTLFAFIGYIVGKKINLKINLIGGITLILLGIKIFTI